jgi:hypothetical protein
MPFTYPGQMFDRTLTPLKGWPSQTALDFDANLSTNVNIGGTNVPPQSGMCVHNTATGFEMGANLTQMAIFLWPSLGDFDVSNPGVPAGVALGGTSTNIPAWIPIRPTGKMVGLVATGGYELETTEFDTAQTYVINQLLRSVTSNSDANAGKLTNQNASGGQSFGSPGVLVAYTDSAVGVVSRGAYTNSHQKQVLAFWPVYLPGTR